VGRDYPDYTWQVTLTLPVPVEIEYWTPKFKEASTTSTTYVALLEYVVPAGRRGYLWLVSIGWVENARRCEVRLEVAGEVKLTDVSVMKNLTTVTWRPGQPVRLDAGEGARVLFRSTDGTSVTASAMFDVGEVKV